MVALENLTTLSVKDVLVTLQWMEEQYSDDLPIVIYSDQTGNMHTIWAIEYDDHSGIVKIISEKQFSGKE